MKRFVVISLFLFMPAFIAHAENTLDGGCQCPPGASEEVKSYCNKINSDIINARQAAMEALMPKPAAESFRVGSCLDRFRGIKTNIFFGSFDVMSIIQSLLDKACDAIASKWNGAVDKVNRMLNVNVSAPVIGTVVGTSSSSTTVGNSGVNVNTSGITNTYNSVNNAYNAVQNLPSQVQNGANTIQNFFSK